MYMIYLKPAIHGSTLWQATVNCVVEVELLLLDSVQQKGIIIHVHQCEFACCIHNVDPWMVTFRHIQLS